MRMTGIDAPAQTASERRQRASLHFPVIRDCCNNPISDARHRQQVYIMASVIILLKLWLFPMSRQVPSAPAGDSEQEKKRARLEKLKAWKQQQAAAPAAPAQQPAGCAGTSGAAQRAACAVGKASLVSGLLVPSSQLKPSVKKSCGNNIMIFCICKDAVGRP